MNIQNLQVRRAEKVAEMRKLTDGASDANRDMTADEIKQFDTLETETRGLNSQIDRATKLDAFEKAQDAQHVAGPGSDGPELRGYSIGKAIFEQDAGKLTGLENEWHQHLVEQRGAAAKGVLIPAAQILETRAVQTDGTGGNMVATNLAKMTDRRRPALRIQQLGATVLSGLTGNLDLPRLASSGTAHWVSEGGSATRSDATFEKRSMGPKTVSGEYQMSRRMLLQSNESMDSILQSDLAFILAQALDAAAIRGGGADEPVGLLADPAITATPSAGNDIGEDTSLLMQSLEIDDVFDEGAFLTNPKIAHESRVSRDTTGQPLPSNWFWHGRPFTLSNQVAENGGQYPIVYGAFSNLILGFWSGIDLLPNRYHQDVASQGGMLIHAFLDADVLVRHPEAFAYVNRAI